MLSPIQRRCDGSALIIALLILIVMTILGISTVTTSTQEMIMAGNTQDSSSSFQASESGITGTMSLVATSNDPFDGKDHTDDKDDSKFNAFYDTTSPFNKKSTHPLYDVEKTGDNIAVNITIHVPIDGVTEVTCPRKARGSSVDIVTCENYVLDSTHTSSSTGAHTKIAEGTSREILTK
jgi:type IV pilus assembly protein PilX